MTEKLLLSVREAAKVLGVSHTLVYDLIRDHGLPTVSWYSQKFVPRAALEEWVRNQTPDEAA